MKNNHKRAIQQQATCWHQSHTCAASLTSQSDFVHEESHNSRHLKSWMTTVKKVFIDKVILACQCQVAQV